MKNNSTSSTDFARLDALIKDITLSTDSNEIRLEVDVQSAAALCKLFHLARRLVTFDISDVHFDSQEPLHQGATAFLNFTIWPEDNNVPF